MTYKLWAMVIGDQSFDVVDATSAAVAREKFEKLYSGPFSTKATLEQWRAEGRPVRPRGHPELLDRETVEVTS